MTYHKLTETQQKLAADQLIILYKLDMTNLGGSVAYFVDAVTSSGTKVKFNNVEYTPIDIIAEGFEAGGTQSPRPTIKIANTSLTLESEVNNYNDLIGAIITRRRTYAKYLDDGTDPDPNAQYQPDIWVINKKLNHNKIYIEWELVAYMDYKHVKLPKRQIIKDICRHNYRYYDSDTSSFNYDNVTCPYTGSNYFKADGTATTDPSEDVCGKHLTDCKLRYPNKNDELPIWSFPGVLRVRIR